MQSKPGRTLIGLLCLILSSATFATSLRTVHSDTETEAVTVEFADLNLSQKKGMEILYRRLKSAANKVCDTRSGKEPLRISRLRKQCFDDSMDNAVSSSGIDGLKALHAS